MIPLKLIKVEDTHARHIVSFGYFRAPSKITGIHIKETFSENKSLTIPY